MNLILSSHIAYEGFLGDPIGGGVRYYFAYDSLTLSFRGGAGIGGFLSYLNLHIMGDVALTAPITGNVAAYMGGGALTGLRVFGGTDVGLGIRIFIGAELRATENLSLGFEFAPLVVKSFGGKSHPGISFGLKAIYYPTPLKTEEPTSEKVETVSKPAPRPAETTVRGKERRKKEVSKGESKAQPPTKGRTVDKEAADREYKLGLQAYANGDLQKAKLHFEAALRYDPNHERARMALEKVKRQLGEE